MCVGRAHSSIVWIDLGGGLMNDLLIGAIAAGSYIVALFFVKFWKSTGDKLFLCFGLAFFLEGSNRLILGGVLQLHAEYEDYSIYLLRLVSYSLILIGIIIKNKARRAEK